MRVARAIGPRARRGGTQGTHTQAEQHTSTHAVLLLTWRRRAELVVEGEVVEHLVGRLDLLLLLLLRDRRRHVRVRPLDERVLLDSSLDGRDR
jgi:hypothetical protein